MTPPVRADHGRPRRRWPRGDETAGGRRRAAGELYPPVGARHVWRSPPDGPGLGSPDGLSARRSPPMTSSPRRRLRRGPGRWATDAAPPIDGGQATVELVLALPVVVLSLLLLVQVALVVRAQVLVVDAAREGARAAAVGASAATASRTTPGLQASRLVVDVQRSPADPSTVRVTVRYRTPTDVALVGPLVPDPELTATVAMRIEDPHEAGDPPPPPFP